MHLTPTLIPDHDWDSACRVLHASIQMAMANPALRAEFEQWLAKKTASSKAAFGDAEPLTEAES